MLLAAAALGLLIGLAVGSVGGGGSVLAVPALVYVLQQDVHEATTASLAVVTAAALAGGLGHARESRVCWRHAGAFTAAALPGVVLGTSVGDAASGGALLAGFALIMLAAAYATWRKAEASVPAESSQPAACPPLRVPRDLFAGASIGFLTGLLGVGGGFLIVPTLAIALAFTMRTAIGTSLAIITATSLMGVFAHLLVGRTFDTGVTGAMAVGAILGALGGAAVAGRIPQRVLGRAFALLVTGVAVYLLAASAFLGGPPGG
jgi:uncharacterized membrane protein YfcA